ncbi:MAG: hypothetical protein M1822_000216 [Bathelium mastoideum]|nr:MAG: hypothetical protein M1822_000216 [Bathelium mastoideum]
MVYGAKEMLADSLVMVAEDIGVPCAIPVARIIVQEMNESNLTALVSQLGACNREESGLSFFDTGRHEGFPTRLDDTVGIRRHEAKRKELQTAVFLPLVAPALAIHRKRLVTKEQRDIICHYYSTLDDPRDQQKHDIRLIKHADGEVYKQVPWNRETGQASLYAICSLPVLRNLESKIGKNHSPLCLIKHNLDPSLEANAHITESQDQDIPCSAGPSESDLWHDRETGSRKIGGGRNQSQKDVLARSLNKIRAETYATALGGAMPHDMFPADNFASLAPLEHRKIRHQSPARSKSDKGKTSRRIFDLSEDPSPPESLMIQREGNGD